MPEIFSEHLFESFVNFANIGRNYNTLEISQDGRLNLLKWPMFLIFFIHVEIFYNFTAALFSECSLLCKLDLFPFILIIAVHVRSHKALQIAHFPTRNSCTGHVAISIIHPYYQQQFSIIIWE